MSTADDRLAAASAPRETTSADSLADRLPALGADWSLARTRELLRQRRWTWARAEILIAEVAVDRVVSRAWLPPALALPAAPARATVFVAHYPDTAMGFAYREAGVLLHATLRRKPVLHCAWMVVDDDTALILGRELLGFPKKLAWIELETRERRPRGAVERRGARVLAMDALCAPATAAPRAAFPFPIVNLRGIPGVLPQWLIAMRPNERCHGCEAVTFRITSEASACDPLATLGLAGDHAGHRLIVDLGHPDAPGASRVPAVPTSWLGPTWLWKAYPFRAW
ncbi:MAG: acetoacetate decarboxylase family protein [bacterium]